MAPETVGGKGEEEEVTLVDTKSIGILENTGVFLRLWTSSLGLSDPNLMMTYFKPANDPRHVQIDAGASYNSGDQKRGFRIARISLVLYYGHSSRDASGGPSNFRFVGFYISLKSFLGFKLS